MDGVDVWASSEDVRLGTDWRESLRTALRDTEYAILCITPQNVDSPWIAMEAGAITMGRGETFPAVPLLFGLGVDDLPSHLSGFQALEATEENLLRVGREVRECLGVTTDHSVFERRLTVHTQNLWQELTRLIAIRATPMGLKHIRSSKALANYRHLVSDVQKAPEIPWPIGGYRFHVFSVGERGTFLPHELLTEVKNGLVDLVTPFISRIDRLVTVVPGGNPWALIIGQELKIPVEIIRDAESGIEGERLVWQKGLLYERKLFFRDRRDNYTNSVLIIDDIVSSGETATLLVNELRESGSNVLAVVAILLKGTAYQQRSKELGIDFFSLLECDEEYVKAGPRPVPHPRDRS